MIELSEVVKKDIRVVIYLLIFGFFTYISNKYLQAGEYSILFGGIANYIVYRVRQELNNEGYNQALRGK